VGLGFELRAFALAKTGFLLLEPHLQSILLWLSWDGGLMNYILGLVLNLIPPDLSLSIS
jgi:hypothetical protein